MRRRDHDLEGGDRIDLHLIDADVTTAGDEAFHFGATAGHTGDVVVVYDAPEDRTVVQLYVDGDAVPDAEILLPGDHPLLSAGDFIL